MPDSDLSSVQQLHLLYQELDQAIAQALKKYPDIQCTSGCSQCCKNYGSPLVAEIEWQNIRQHWPQLDPAIKKIILSNYHSLKNNLRQRLKKPEKAIAADLFHTPCPFLIEDKCSIYAKRPLSCRAFGISQHGTSKGLLSERIFACSMEIERWEKSLPMHDEPDLPIQQTYFEQLQDIDKHPLKTLLSYLDQEIRHDQHAD